VPWTPNTYYDTGAPLVTNGGKSYRLVKYGKTASSGGPTGFGNITDGTVVWRQINRWYTATTYVVGDLCISYGDTKAFICTTGGTSSAGPPAVGGADGTVVWSLLTMTTWLPVTAYGVGDCVVNSARQFVCVTAGTSGARETFVLVDEGRTAGAESTGPTGTGEMIDGTCKWVRELHSVGATAWAASTAYAVGDVRVNPGLTGYNYTCTQAGTSGTTSTWSSALGIKDGECVWVAVRPWQPSVRYAQDVLSTNDNGKCYKVIAGTSAASGGPSGSGTGILDGTVVWDSQTTFAFTQLTSMSLQQQQTISTGADFTLTAGLSPHRTLYTGTITANRAVTLSTAGAFAGLSYKISRTATGAFNLNVGTGPLKALAVNTWCEVTHDGTAWYLSGYGAL
jgi:hypothetical protein